jgi:hypothetical protein
MIVKIYAPCSGWRMVPADEAEHIPAHVVEVSDETAARWQAVLEQYATVQREMQAVVDASMCVVRDQERSYGTC